MLLVSDAQQVALTWAQWMASLSAGSAADSYGDFFVEVRY